MIDALYNSTSFLFDNIISGIFVSVFILIVVKVLSRQRVRTATAGQVIRWVILTYAITALLTFILTWIAHPTKLETFFQRASGLYWWAYLTMIIANPFLPLILLHKKIGSKLAALFVVAVLMNIGWLFESFIIYTTAIHRDFGNSSIYTYLPTYREVGILLRGILIGLIALFWGNVIDQRKINYYKQKENHSNSKS